MATRTVISRCSGGFLRWTLYFIRRAASVGRDHEGREVVPGVGDLGEGVQAEALGLLGDLLAAHRLVEHARAVRLEHPEVEAELAVAHEVPRAGAHEAAADAAALLR